MLMILRGYVLVAKKYVFLASALKVKAKEKGQ